MFDVLFSEILVIPWTFFFLYDLLIVLRDEATVNLGQVLQAF